MNDEPPFNAETLTRLRRKRNLLKWGKQNYPDGTVANAETRARRAEAKAREHAALRAGRLTWLDILNEEFAEAACETETHKLLSELIDVAAVAQEWADEILRRHA
jgi:hypothetical protein